MNRGLAILAALSSVLLALLIGILVINALFWGGWQRDGMGPIGFWPVMWDGLLATAPKIAILVAGILIPGVILRRKLKGLSEHVRGHLQMKPRGRGSI